MRRSNGTAGIPALADPKTGRGSVPCALCLSLCLLLVAGCGGGKIPKTFYYKLNLPDAPVATGNASGEKTAIVMPFRASEMLIQDKIVYRPNPEEVGFYEYHRWAEDPRTTVTASLMDHLRQKGTFSRLAESSNSRNATSAAACRCMCGFRRR
jgi:uncharacterized lipoprotein YmbA